MSDTNALTTPESKAQAVLTEEPTVLVCAGEAGIAMGKEVQRLARREGIAERVQMIAINTGSGKFGGLGPDVATINLKTPDRRFQHHDAAVRHYIDGDTSRRGGNGSGRNRAIGRYHFDNPELIVAKIESTIREAITSFVERFQNDPDVDGIDAANVFQLVGAGGGTGSGITPLLTGCLDEMLQELDEEMHPGFEHWAVLSLAAERYGDSDVNWHYVGNSLALLDEMRAITGYDDVTYPIRIPIYSSNDGDNNVPDAYEIESNPFSGVFLLRYDQDESEDETYQRGAIRTVARTVIEWMRKGEGTFMDVENEANDLDHVFYEIQGVTFETPDDDVSKLLDANRDKASADEEVQRYAALLEEIDAAIEQLSVATDARTILKSEQLVAPDAYEGADDERPAPEPLRTAFERAEQIASNIDPQNIRMEGVEAEFTEHRDRQTHSFHDRLDDDTVETAVFMAAMLERTESALRSHRFNGLVHEFVESNESTITDFDPTFDSTAEPKEQYVHTVRPLLDDQIESLTAQRDGFSLRERIQNRGEYAAVTDRLESTEETRQQLQRALEARDQLAQLAEDLETAYDTAVASLEETRQSLSADRDDVQSDLNTARQEREAAEKRVQRHMAAIRDAPLGRFVTLPVAEDTELSADLFADDPGITDLIESGVIEREAVVTRIRQTLRDHEEGELASALESRGVERNTVRGRVRAFCTPSTRELVWDDAPSGTVPATLADNEFPHGQAVVESTDDHMIGLLAVYGHLELDNFDHGALRDSLFHGRAEWKGEPVPLADCYAYPEILPDDHPMSMQRRVDDCDLPAQGDIDD